MLTFPFSATVRLSPFPELLINMLADCKPVVIGLNFIFRTRLFPAGITNGSVYGMLEENDAAPENEMEVRRIS